MAERAYDGTKVNTEGIYPRGFQATLEGILGTRGPSITTPSTLGITKSN